MLYNATMHDLSFTFTAKLWLYAGKGAWFFVTLPDDVAGQIRFFSGRRQGFGSVRVVARIGTSTWKTSVFPDSKSGSYLLPVKAEIRKAQNIGNGDNVSVSLALDI
jgi:Domain of unknown function (DUF1905)